MQRFIGSAFILIMACATAHAEERFAVIDRGETIIRVDTQTGRVSYCRQDGDKPVCKIAAEEREAWMTEVEQLEKRISQLEAGDSKSPNKMSPKEDEDLEKALDTAETMMRRFFGIIETLKDDLRKN